MATSILGLPEPKYKGRLGGTAERPGGGTTREPYPAIDGTGELAPKSPIPATRGAVCWPGEQSLRIKPAPSSGSFQHSPGLLRSLRIGLRSMSALPRLPRAGRRRASLPDRASAPASMDGAASRRRLGPDSEAANFSNLRASPLVANQAADDGPPALGPSHRRGRQAEAANSGLPPGLGNRPSQYRIETAAPLG